MGVSEWREVRLFPRNCWLYGSKFAVDTQTHSKPHIQMSRNTSIYLLDKPEIAVACKLAPQGSFPEIKTTA